MKNYFLYPLTKWWAANPYSICGAEIYLTGFFNVALSDMLYDPDDKETSKECTIYLN